MALAAACGRTAKLGPVAGAATGGASEQDPGTAGSLMTVGQPTAGTAAAGAAQVASGGAPSSAGTTAGGTEGAEGGAGGSSETPPLQVSGVVVAADESPIGGLTIRVDGVETTTRPDGSFEIAAKIPYDLMLYQPSYITGREQLISSQTDLYLGVTLSKVKLYTTTPPTRAGEIAGSTLMPPAVAAEGTTLVDMWSGPHDRGPGTSIELPNELADFRFTEAVWSGPDKLPATLLVFRTDGPLNYSGDQLSAMAIVPVVVSDATVTHIPTVTLSKPTWHDLQLDVAAQDARFNACEVGVWAGSHLGLYSSANICQSFHVTVHVPDGLPEGTLSIFARGFDDKHQQVYELRQAIASNATQASPSLPHDLLTFESPPRGFSGKVSAIVLSHQPLEHALGLITLSYFDGAAGRYGRVKVYSSDSSVAFERIVAAGVPGMKAAAELHWDLEGIGNVSTVDQYLASDRIADASSSAIFMQLLDPYQGHWFSYSPD
jgi:hypothetical protein